MKKLIYLCLTLLLFLGTVVDTQAAHLCDHSQHENCSDAVLCHTLELGSGGRRLVVSELDSFTLRYFQEMVPQIEDEALREFMGQVLKGYRHIYVVSDIAQISPRVVTCCHQMLIWQGLMNIFHARDFQRICFQVQRMYYQRCLTCNTIHGSWVVFAPGCGFNCGW